MKTTRFESDEGPVRHLLDPACVFGRHFALAFPPGPGSYADPIGPINCPAAPVRASFALRVYPVRCIRRRAQFINRRPVPGLYGSWPS